MASVMIPASVARMFYPDDYSDHMDHRSALASLDLNFPFVVVSKPNPEAPVARKARVDFSETDQYLPHAASSVDQK